MNLKLLSLSLSFILKNAILKYNFKARHKKNRHFNVCVLCNVILIEDSDSNFDSNFINVIEFIT